MNFSPIGTIHTPYKEIAPFRADESIDEGIYKIEVFPEFADALYKLEMFNYIHILFWIDKSKPFKLRVHPPYENAGEVGLFASRSPNRINPIGLSTVKLLNIEDNILITSCLDVLNGTPLLDIKPYIRDLDLKENANLGWKV